MKIRFAMEVARKNNIELSKEIQTFLDNHDNNKSKKNYKK